MTVPGSLTLTSTLTTVVTELDIRGPLIQLKWKASDISIISQQPSVPGAPTGSPPAAGQSSLSSGAVLAIALTVPLSLLSLAFIIVCIYLYRTKRRYQKQSQIPPLDSREQETQTDDCQDSGTAVELESNELRISSPELAG